MASIKTQKLVYCDKEKGYCSSGSASIIGSAYDTSVNSGHCRHWVIESLGKVIQYDENNRCGVFLSPLRGLVSYDLGTDQFDEVSVDDPRIQHSGLVPSLISHTTFGNVYFALYQMVKSGLMGVLHQSFPDQTFFERVLSHVIHSAVSNSERIQCGDFILHSFLSHIVKDLPLGTLNCDSSYFSKMGEHEIKLTFFRNYIAFMRKTNPNFGRGCYVDSTPLPNDVENNPFNYFSNHGTDGNVSQTRMVLILDEETGKPIWYTFVPGNVLDLHTISTVEKELDVNLNIEVDSLVLDAGYAYQSLFERYNIDNSKIYDNLGNLIRERSLIVRMPEKNGYPYGDLYQLTKDLLHDVQYDFCRGNHTYFGMRFEREDVCNCHEYCYVYLDRDRALSLNGHFMREHPDEWNAMTPEEKNWAAVKDGFFILVSCKETTPALLLDEYFGRTRIESLFKTLKEYLAILPLRKWSVPAIKGKILNDIMALLVFQECQSQAAQLGKELSKLFVDLSVLECMLDKENIFQISTPPKQIREAFIKMDIPLYGHISLDDINKLVYECVMPARPSITKPMGRRPGSTKKGNSLRVPLSKEQKEAAKLAREEEKRKKREEEKAAKKAAKLALREEEKKRKAEAKEQEKLERQKERAAEKEKTDAERKAQAAQRIPVRTGRRGRPRLVNPDQNTK